MLKCMDRYIPEDQYVDECEPNSDDMVWVWDDPAKVKAYSTHYTQQLIIHYGAVEFKTLKDLEKVYESEE